MSDELKLYSCCPVTFPVPALKRVDQAAAKANVTREEMVRIMLCEFGKKHGVTVPPEPVAKPITYGAVGILVPTARKGSWLDELLTKSGITSTADLTRHAACDYYSQPVP